ncbi:hypothetical protein EIP91_003003 [Steccherinum ochraceum]|uniref:Uncharacterized protein n=1 Tax=Steccherinum ochraceum TaxID=92696 RepID=A0A4R0RB61_9APHY|nr:hypothetical protein EIP91_003003 [Steccherinum ochraceum]
MGVATVSATATVHTGRTTTKIAIQSDVGARVTKIVLKDINVVSARDVGYYRDNIGARSLATRAPASMAASGVAVVRPGPIVQQPVVIEPVANLPEGESVVIEQWSDGDGGDV